MRIILSTPKRLARAKATRRPRSSRIGAVDGVILAMANPTATARRGNQIISPKVDAMANPTATARRANQITSPMVGAMAGVQAAGEVANASTRLVTDFPSVPLIPPRRHSHCASVSSGFRQFSITAFIEN